MNTGPCRSPRDQTASSTVRPGRLSRAFALQPKRRCVWHVRVKRGRRAGSVRNAFRAPSVRPAPPLLHLAALEQTQSATRVAPGRLIWTAVPSAQSATRRFAPPGPLSRKSYVTQQAVSPRVCRAQTGPTRTKLDLKRNARLSPAFAAVRSAPHLPNQAFADAVSLTRPRRRPDRNAQTAEPGDPR